MNEKKSKIEVNHVIKKFKKKTVLQDVSLNCTGGKIYGIVRTNYRREVHKERMSRCIEVNGRKHFQSLERIKISHEDKRIVFFFGCRNATIAVVLWQR